MTTMTVRNGIDLDRLQATAEALESDAQLGQFTFRAGSRWEDGTHNVGAIGRFTHAGELDDGRTQSFRLEGDEPPILLGENKGPNAVESGLLVGAVAGQGAGQGEVAFARELRGLLRTRTGVTVPDDVRHRLQVPASTRSSPPARWAPWARHRRAGLRAGAASQAGPGRLR